MQFLREAAPSRNEPGFPRGRVATTCARSSRGRSPVEPRGSPARRATWADARVATDQAGSASHGATTLRAFGRGRLAGSVAAGPLALAQLDVAHAARPRSEPDTAPFDAGALHAGTRGRRARRRGMVRAQTQSVRRTLRRRLGVRRNVLRRRRTPSPFARATHARGVPPVRATTAPTRASTASSAGAAKSTNARTRRGANRPPTRTRCTGTGGGSWETSTRRRCPASSSSSTW